jgi:hypothetical protein
MSCSSKIVVFDLDETLGYFMELGMFWDALKAYITHTNANISIDQTLFNNILDLYPEFLRPNIINILNYLKRKKTKNHCDKLIIYTNNQGPIEWAKYIINYFNNKLSFNIFDQLISAFKVKGKRVELCRTTHQKTHSDFIKCTKIPEDTQICFLDDVYYPDMSNDKIYYINIKPYEHDLDFETMLVRCFNSGLLGTNNDAKVYKTFMNEYLKKYHFTYVKKTTDAQNIDKIVSKKILEHLHIFFNMKPVIKSSIKSKRHKQYVHNKTRKRKSSSY